MCGGAECENETRIVGCLLQTDFLFSWPVNSCLELGFMSSESLVKLGGTQNKAWAESRLPAIWVTGKTHISLTG